MYQTARLLLVIPFLGMAMRAVADEAKGDATKLPAHAERRLLAKDKPVAVHSVAFAPSGKLLASGDAEGFVHVWDAESGKLRKSFKAHEGTVRTLAFAPDGARLASGGQDGALRLWSVEGEEIWKKEPHPEYVSAVTFSPDGKLIATGGGEKTVRTWAAKDGKEQIAYYGLRQPAYTIAFREDGKVLAAGGRDRSVAVWDVESGKITQQCKGHRSWVLAVAFDGTTLISAGRDQTIRYWDDWNGKNFLRMGGWDGEIHALGLARKNALLVTGDANAVVRFRNTSTGQEIAHWAGHTEAITCLAVEPSSTRLATGSQDGSVLVWNLKDVALADDKRQPADGKDRQTLWTALTGDDDEPETHMAIRRLIAGKEETIRFLRKEVPPVAADANARVLTLISQLDSDDFKTRENAQSALLKHGALTVPAVRQALAGKLPSLEVRRRMERILDQLPVEQLQRERERERRALQVLERMNTPESRKLVQELADGAPDAALTVDAKSTLERMEKRK